MTLSFSGLAGGARGLLRHGFVAAVIGLLVLLASLPAAYAGTSRGDRYAGLPWATRSPVLAQHGMVATEQPIASLVAVEILKKGGSAVDAAIAANAVLGLMQPVLNGIGGDAFAIVWDPKTHKLYGYNGSGPSAKGRDLKKMRAEVAAAYGKAGMQPSDQIPLHGSLPVTCPVPWIPGSRCTRNSASCRWPRIWRRRSGTQKTDFRLPSWLRNTGKAISPRSKNTAA